MLYDIAAVVTAAPSDRGLSSDIGLETSDQCPDREWHLTFSHWLVKCSAYWPKSKKLELVPIILYLTTLGH
jgi:hypothetical protein